MAVLGPPWSAPGLAAICSIAVPSVILASVPSLIPPSVVRVSACPVVSVFFSVGAAPPFTLVLPIPTFLPSGHVFVAAATGSAVHVVTVVIAVLRVEIWFHLKPPALYTVPRYALP